LSRKVLVLSASPRRGGNSDLLCDQFMLGARQAGHSADKIFLKDKKINYCTGCGTCLNGKKPCPQKDDMAEVLKRMVAADVIALATPVYFYTMNGQMKTLIDRTCSRYAEISDKQFVFIVAAADDSRPAMERTLEGFRAFLSCLNEPKEIGVVYGVGAWSPGDIQGKPAMQEAFALGAALK
jgi:multimeric flavodoxin WrbA